MNAFEIPIYDCKLRDLDNTGLYAMSFVKVPANNRHTVAMKKMQVQLSLDKYRQILTGAVLVPGQLIYRQDDSLGKYYIRFTAADIDKIADKMMRTKLALDATTHQHSVPLKGNYLREVWIVTDPLRDKSLALGMGQQVKGTLCASYKITDANYWRDEVLTGNVRGFSIEGIFNFKSIDMNKPVKTAAQAAQTVGLSKFGKILQALGVPVLAEDTQAAVDALADEAKKDETGSGEPFLIFELADGTEMSTDDKGYCTIDGEQMPAGEHQLADGNFVEIDDAGMLVVTQAQADSQAPTEAAVAAAKMRAAKFVEATKLAVKAGKTTPPAKKPAPVGKDAEIANLKERLAALEKSPSVAKAVPGNDIDKLPADATTTQKMAAVLANRIKNNAKK